jgi:hypothetical protein
MNSLEKLITVKIKKEIPDKATKEAEKQKRTEAKEAEKQKKTKEKEAEKQKKTKEKEAEKQKRTKEKEEIKKQKQIDFKKRNEFLFNEDEERTEETIGETTEEEETIDGTTEEEEETTEEILDEITEEEEEEEEQEQQQEQQQEETEEDILNIFEKYGIKQQTEEITFLYEEYNIKKVCFLYENLGIFKGIIFDTEYFKTSPEKLLIEYNKYIQFLENIIINDCKIKVNYITNEGRSSAKKSIQGISKIIRNFLLENEGLKDIDIENAICAILIPVFEKHNIKCATIKYYYENREEIIDKYYNGIKDNAKRFINSSFFKNAEWIKPNNNFEKKVKSEIKNLQDTIYNLEEYEKYKLKAIETETKKNKKNFKGVFLCNIYHYLENLVLNHSLNYYKQKTNKKIFVKMFDGFISDEDAKFKIDELSSFISELLNFKIKFVYKPIENIELPKITDKFILDTNIITTIKANYYNKLFYKHKIIITETSDDTYATILNVLYGDYFIFNNKNQQDDIFLYYKINLSYKWIKNNIPLIKSFISDKLTEIYNIISRNLFNLKCDCDKKGETDKGEQIQKNINSISKASKRFKGDSGKNAILECLKVLLSKRLDDIDFDIKKPYYFSFNNITFDIRTGERVEVLKTDYLTFSTGYNYIEPTREEMDEIEEIIDNIFTDKETKRTYLSVLYSGLSGIRLEKFIMCNGCGRNGKGLINELMIKTLGEDYSYTGNINTLTKELKSGPNPEVAGLHKKRFVKFEEPNDTDYLQLGNIKKITGEGFLNARMCNSNDTKCLLFLTMVYECNKKSAINGKIDMSAIERFINIYFSSFFTNNEEELKTNSNAKPINTKYKTNEFQEKIRCAFFKYIIQNAEKDLYISKQIKQETREYLLENDEVFNWFNDNYILCDPLEYLEVKEIMKTFKQSEFYNNLSKSQKRSHTEKTFKETIKNNIELKKYFKERHTDKKTNKGKYSVILGWKQKNPEEEEDEETEPNL